MYDSKEVDELCVDFVFGFSWLKLHVFLSHAGLMAIVLPGMWQRGKKTSPPPSTCN